MYDPLNEIIGQSSVKVALKKIIDSERFPHALLFTGKEGVGKEFTAIQLAKYLAIKSNVNNIDFVLNHINKLNEPYIKYICALPRGKSENEQDAPYDKLKPNEISLIQNEFQNKANNPYYSIEIPNANNIKINSIRDISHFISLAYEGNFNRIIIISNAHLMKDEAQNALLKNLEEPPEKIIFILTTPYPELLRETILSRCWRINFENLKNDEVKTILLKYFNIDEDIASKVSEVSLGSIKNALLYLEYDLDHVTDKTIKILRYSFGKKFHSALTEMEEVVSDKMLFKTVISLIITWLSYYNKYRYSNIEIPLTQFDETIKKFTKNYPSADIVNIIQTLEDFSFKLDRNINPNIIGSNLIIRLSSII